MSRGRREGVPDLAQAQVFRTYNASITLDALLHKDSNAATVDERKAEYDRANKEVGALACSGSPFPLLAR